MTGETLIAATPLTAAGRDRAENNVDRAGRSARRRRRNGFWSRPRGSLGGSPPGAGGRLLQL